MSPQSSVSVVLALFAVLFTTGARADLVETKFKVTGSFYDEIGNAKKFVKTRAFVRYDTDAEIFSESAKKNCRVTSGKTDALSLWTEEDSYECISNKTFVIVDENAVVDMFYRSAGFSFLSTLFAEKSLTDQVSDIREDAGTVVNYMQKDQGDVGTLRARIRKILSQASKTQTISLSGRTKFVLKGKGNAKCVIELEPVKLKTL